MDQELGRFVVTAGAGFESRYGHPNAILVREEEQVLPGQATARVGNTGLSTGPHMDFRLRFAGRWQNPLQYF
ncbi:MAG: M23 family metallopeptidase [Clostridia bacterium]|nr:MAG: M23 family metallopeptidase [Clostridia bacterium]